MKRLLYLLFLLPVAVCAQTGSQNYIKTLTYRDSTQTSDATKARASVTYFDGLGRPIQQIAGKMATSGKDLITPIEYDGFGRQSKEYLPYPSSTSDLGFDGSAVANVLTYYSTTSPTTPNLYPQETTGNPYSEKFFEPSPLSRVLKQGAPGAAWQGNADPYNNNDHTVKFSYLSNADNEVRKLKATATWNATAGVYDIAFVSDGYYPASQLYKTVTKSENWTSGVANTTEEFKNKEGQVVLKRTYNGTTAHDTYYVYDQFGNLTYVLPPLCNGANTYINTLGYQYKYDVRNRLVEKKLPGKQWESIVYDKLDRPILTGPAITPFGGAASASGQTGWIMTVYDSFGRIALTGWFPETFSPFTRNTRQSSATFGSGVVNAVRGSGTIDSFSVGYATIASLPAGFKLLTVNYYDDYTWPGAPTLPTQVEGQNIRSKAKGLPTGSWTRVLTTSAGTERQLAYTLYDRRGRAVSTNTTNYLGGYTQTDTKLDFDASPLYTITKHKRVAADTELAVREDFTYDAQDRLLTHNHKINANGVVPLAINTYNELGQLISKGVGAPYAKPFVGTAQVIDYKYNIRGWLTDINDVSNLGTDLFAFRIAYNNPTDYTNGNLSIKSLYNGNISETYWRSSSDNVLRKYSYRYDDLNRLINSYYQKPKSSVVLTGSYNESLSYDMNGNITILDRAGGLDDVNTQVFIDNLVYTYTPNTNQISKVEDYSGSNQGFKDTGSPTGIEYTYDLNGNMLTDTNKGITDIKYNHLNLPTEINFNGNKITYLYDAGGKKLKKTVIEGSASVVVDYFNGFQYKAGVLQFFPTAEGYVDNTVTSGGANSYNYIYQYKDHLGNVRLSYTAAVAFPSPLPRLIIKEENHYYPFGLKHMNYNMDYLEYQNIEGNIELYPPLDPTAKLRNNYKYQGQELQDELGLGWYSFKWRNYNPEIARFMSVDPLAEKYAYQTPYQFASNQPVHANEIEGLESRNDLNLRQTTSVTNDAISRNGNLSRTVQLATSQPRNQTQSNVRAQATISQGLSPAQYKQNEANVASLEIAKNTVSNHDNLGSPYTQNSVMVGAAYGAAGEVAGLAVGKAATSIGKLFTSSASNPVPATLARVVPTEFASGTLGKASAEEVFVTAGKDINGLNSAQIAEKLTIDPSPSGFTVYEFPTPPEGVSTPFNRPDPGFINGGRTAGGAREFIIPNQSIPTNSTTTILTP